MSGGPQYLCPQNEIQDQGAASIPRTSGRLKITAPAGPIAPCYCRSQLQVWLPEGYFRRANQHGDTEFTHGEF
jgi:hypothetical protein